MLGVGAGLQALRCRARRPAARAQAPSVPVGGWGSGGDTRAAWGLVAHRLPEAAATQCGACGRRAETPNLDAGSRLQSTGGRWELPYGRVLAPCGGQGLHGHRLSHLGPPAGPQAESSGATGPKNPGRHPTPHPTPWGSALSAPDGCCSPWSWERPWRRRLGAAPLGARAPLFAWSNSSVGSLV